VSIANKGVRCLCLKNVFFFFHAMAIFVLAFYIFGKYFRSSQVKFVKYFKIIFEWQKEANVRKDNLLSQVKY
jgi:hypothetical protein